MSAPPSGLRKRRVHRFVQIPSKTIRDTRLSFRARGLLAYLLDQADGWVVKSDHLAAQGTEGREAVRTALRELAACGYYRIERRQSLNGKFAMGTAISEEPVDSWAEECAEYDNKPVVCIEQKDGSFKVQHKDGTLTSDGFDDPAVDGNPDPDDDPPPEGASPTEDGFSGFGSPGFGLPGPGFPESGQPDSGFSGVSSKTNPQIESAEVPDDSLRSPSGEPSGLRAVPPTGPADSTPAAATKAELAAVKAGGGTKGVDWTDQANDETGLPFRFGKATITMTEYVSGVNDVTGEKLTSDERLAVAQRLTVRWFEWAKSPAVDMPPAQTFPHCRTTVRGALNSGIRTLDLRNALQHATKTSAPITGPALQIALRDTTGKGQQRRGYDDKKHWGEHSADGEAASIAAAAEVDFGQLPDDDRQAG